MAQIFLLDIDRPGLPRALAERGLATSPYSAGGSVPQAGTVLVVGVAANDAMRPLADINPDGAMPVICVIDGDEQGLVAALDAGACDAVLAGSSDGLIAARVGALLRREAAARWLRIGDLCIDTLDCRVSRAGQPIALLPREYRLLLTLARRPGEIVPRQSLVKALCGLAFDPGTNVIEVHISRLRAKIDRGFANPVLHTERGRGYRLAVSHNAIAATPAAR
jgi:two-component system OmpR family response regulator